ncbi:MAG: hypothetical protein DCF22_09495 [Leptolyngbya sp.]|nr:MAG: hypothetical protein DCF22_09495 [Leptolyngbya sp.]
MLHRDRAPHRSWLYLLAAITLAGWSTPVTAQVIPDATLGNGNNSTTLINGIRTDINGGLRRGSALFHSFERFGILTNHEVYFTNPAGIRNIFSRVTGGNISNIDGLLGVSGGANLFFMNPNGIIFGPNARLDVSGSFLATTANVLQFADGQKFAADGDRAVPLVEVNIPIGLQYGANPPAMLTNRGILATGQDLTLASNNLDLQGQLQAGGNLTLNATDTVKIRDTVTEPFMARSGGDMMIQGDRGVDILALNHPTITPFVSGGNLSLVSDGIISGDAHYASGGTFQIKSISGQPANFLSLYDPVISSAGDIDISGTYNGPALLVESLGDIRFLGNVNITGNDPAFANNANTDLATLGNSAALIVRANRNALAFAPNVPPNTTFSGATFQAGAVPAGITIGGGITTNAGPVILEAVGPISLGAAGGFSAFASSIAIDTNGALTASGILSVRRDGPQRAGNIVIGNNGNSDSSINEPGSRQPSSVTIGAISTRNLVATNNGGGGNITVKTSGPFSTTGAVNAVSGQPAVLDITNPDVFSIASEASAGQSGNISIISTGGLVNLANRRVSSASNFNGKGGNITLEGTSVDTSGGVIRSLNDGTIIGGVNTGFTPTGGSAGNVRLTATAGNVSSGSIIASYLNNVDGGFARINLTSNTGSVLLDQARLSTTNLGSRDSGDIFIDADQNVQITNSTAIESEGTFGRILIGDNSSIDRVTIQNSSLSAQVRERHNVGPTPSSIRITAGEIQVNDSSIDASTESVIRGGDVRLQATGGGTVTVNGSRVQSTVRPTATGNGGNIQVITGQLSLANGSLLSTSDQSTAITTGGNITVNATGAVVLERNSSIRTNVEFGSRGNGGNITIAEASSLSLTGGSRLSAQTSGTQDVGGDNARAGNINVTVNGAIDIAGSSPAGQASGLLTSTDQTGSGQGGNIDIQATGNLQIRDRAILSARTQSTSDGGNITVNVNRLEALNGGQLTTTSTNSGAAGTITVTAPNGVLLSGVAPPPGVVSPFVGLVIPEITATQDVIGDGTFPYFGFAVTAAGSIGTFDIDNGIKTGGGPTSIDTELFLFNRDTGELLASNDDNFSTPLPGGGGSISGLDSFINFTFSTPGNYVVGVGRFNSFASNNSLIQGNSPQPGQTFTLVTAIANQGTSSPPPANQSQSSGFFAEATGISNAGQVNINSRQVTVADGAGISTSTNSGVGGNITLQNVNTLQLDNGRIAASTLVGRAGNLTVNSGGVAADAIALSNNSSLSLAATTPGGAGTAGDISLNTRQLTVQGNSSIFASTAGSGAAGNLTVGANGGTADAINLLSGSSLVLGSTGSGNAGNILLDTRQLTVQDSLISASTVAGTGGSITLQNANDLQLDNGQISASTQTGQAGSLNVNAANSVTLNNGSALSVAATGSGNSGAVSLTTPQLTVNNSQILASTISGVGGDITLQGLNTLQMNNGEVVASTQTGRAGSVAVSASGNIDLLNGSRIAVEANGANGVAGNVTVTGRDISLVGGASRSRISTSATGAGASAGNVTINAVGRTITLQNSDVLASSQQGTSGNITITSRRLDLNNGTIKAEIGQNTANQSGSIKLDVSFRLTLENESEISTLGRNGANGGDISILNVRFLFGRRATGANGSDIVGRAEGGGRGGRVFLDRSTLVQGFLFRRAVDGNRTNDIDTNGQLDNFSTNADEGTRGLSKPLIIFSDVAQIASSACEAVGAKASTNSELRIAGRGGVASSPTAPLSAQATTSDWVSLELSPQVPVQVTLSDGKPMTLEPGQVYQLQATCVNAWKEQQRSLL